MSVTVFVTGGSGFVGGAVIQRFVQSGAVVRALARSEAAVERVESLGARAALGDLASVEVMRTAMQGASLVVHCAALADDWGRPEAFAEANVRGTANVLRAARAAGVARVVHVGTEAALMHGQPLVDVDETYPLAPDSPVPYSASKARAEIAVVAANEPGVFETVVVRPRLVWGKGDTNLLPELVRAARSGRLKWVDGGRHLTATTHVRNVVEGIVLAGRVGRAGHAYFVTDGPPVQFRTFISRLLETQGVEVPAAQIPGWVASTVRIGGEAVWKALPLPGAPPITRLAHWFLTLDCTIDTTKARTELGYVPIVTIEEGLGEMRAG